MSVEDLRCVLRHHWVYDQERYPTERQRLQILLLLLISAFTASRPEAIVESGCAKGSNRALRYCDIGLTLIPDPSGWGGWDVWAMKIMFVFMKGSYHRLNPWVDAKHPNITEAKKATVARRSQSRWCQKHLVRSLDLSKHLHLLELLATRWGLYVIHLASNLLSLPASFSLSMDLVETLLFLTLLLPLTSILYNLEFRNTINTVVQYHRFPTVVNINLSDRHGFLCLWFLWAVNAGFSFHYHPSLEYKWKHRSMMTTMFYIKHQIVMGRCLSLKVAQFPNISSARHPEPHHPTEINKTFDSHLL